MCLGLLSAVDHGHVGDTRESCCGELETSRHAWILMELKKLFNYYHIALSVDLRVGAAPWIKLSLMVVSLQMTISVRGISSSMMGIVVRAGHVVPSGPGHHGRGCMGIHSHVTHGGVGTGVATGSCPIGLIDHGLNYSPSCIDEPIVDL